MADRKVANTSREMGNVQAWLEITNKGFHEMDAAPRDTQQMELGHNSKLLRT